MNQSIKINITGDFFLPNVDGWKFDNHLSDMLQGGDINVVNLEAPLRTDGAKATKKSGPSICQDERALDFLASQGFHIADCANNHIFDYGKEALVNTLNSVLSSMLAIGVGTFNEAYNINVVEKGGVKIGFLALTQYEFGIHDDALYSADKIGAAWMCHPCVADKIRHAHEVCDYLIVLPHAGLEHFALPLPEIRTLYRSFVDLGADAVVASHPHIPQPYEEYKETPIFYSLGNFCFDLSVNNRPYWNKGLVAQLEIIPNEGIKSSYVNVSFDCVEKIVSLNDNPEFSIFMDEQSKTFNNEIEYLEMVNSVCLESKWLYAMILEMASIHKVTSVRKALSLLKQHLSAIVKGKSVPSNDAHFINTMRCETHRWVMSRIYELENKN